MKLKDIGGEGSWFGRGKWKIEEVTGKEKEGKRKRRKRVEKKAEEMRRRN